MKKIILALIVALALLIGCSNVTNSKIDVPVEKEPDSELIAYAISFIDASNRKVDEGTPITNKSSEFIEGNLELFMNHDKEASQQLLDPSIDYQHLDKNIEKYSGTMFQDYGVIVDIYDMEDENLGKTLTVIQLLKDNINYQVLYYGKTEYEIYDALEFIGLPLMKTSFKNVGGSTTSLYMILASNLDWSTTYVDIN